MNAGKMDDNCILSLNAKKIKSSASGFHVVIFLWRSLCALTVRLLWRRLYRCLLMVSIIDESDPQHHDASIMIVRFCKSRPLVSAYAKIWSPERTCAKRIHIKSKLVAYSYWKNWCDATKADGNRWHTSHQIMIQDNDVQRSIGFLSLMGSRIALRKAMTFGNATQRH